MTYILIICYPIMELQPYNPVIRYLTIQELLIVLLVGRLNKVPNFRIIC